MKIHLSRFITKSGWDGPLQGADSAQTMVLAFFAPELARDPSWLADIKARFPHSQMIGCSTAGEIYGSKVYDESVSVAVVSFEKTELRLQSFPIESPDDSFSVGRQMADSLNAPNLSGVFIISEGVNISGADLTAGLASRLPLHVPVTGGLAGDGPRFGETWVIADGQLKKNCVSAIGFYGPHIRIGHGSHGGWDIFGPERVISRSEGNVLYELDGKPALDLYKKYLGERAIELPASGLFFPLQIWSPQRIESQQVRTITAINEKTNSLIFGSDIPQGWHAQLMKANLDRLVEGAVAASGKSLLPHRGSNRMLSIPISCVGRRRVLLGRSEDELEGVLESLPASTAQVGFYSYGELAPNNYSSICLFHNQTMTITTLDEVLD